MSKSKNHNDLYRVLWQCAENISVEQHTKWGTKCWVHQNSASNNYVWVKTRDSEYFPGRNSTSLHRLMYAVYNDMMLSETDVIMHTCDNTKCINPKHLKLGTIKENNQDRARKQRAKKIDKSAE